MRATESRYDCEEDVCLARERRNPSGDCEMCPTFTSLSVDGRSCEPDPCPIVDNGRPDCVYDA